MKKSELENYAARLRALAERLKDYNLWRRGAEDLEQPNPCDLGDDIDAAVSAIESYALTIEARCRSARKTR